MALFGQFSTGSYVSLQSQIGRGRTVSVHRFNSMMGVDLDFRPPGNQRNRVHSSAGTQSIRVEERNADNDTAEPEAPGNTDRLSVPGTSLRECVSEKSVSDVAETQPVRKIISMGVHICLWLFSFIRTDNRGRIRSPVERHAAHSRYDSMPQRWVLSGREDPESSSGTRSRVTRSMLIEFSRSKKCRGRVFPSLCRFSTRVRC